MNKPLEIDEMIKIWGRASSSNVQALMWAVEELGLTYERYDAGFVYGGTDTPEFLGMNPNGTIPVLKNGNNEPIWETGAILRYLSAQYGDDAFWPSDLTARSQVDQWAEWAKINIATKFTVPIFWRVVRTAPSQRDSQAIQDGITTLVHFLEIAEQRLSKHHWLVSSKFSLADIQFGHVLYRYFDIDIERPNLPNLQDYYSRLCERHAFLEHVVIPYDELRVED